LTPETVGHEPAALRPPDPADSGPPDAAEAEAQIHRFFERNLLELQAEGGHALAPEVRETALQQVLLYWRRLRSLAERVTDTEVKLSLPEQRTPRGRTFAIEGVVDIVREEGRTTLYDVKTHPPDEVRANAETYARQLNVYTHIWQGLRGERVDETAIICTAFPESLTEALRSGDEGRLAKAMERWDPVIGIPFDEEEVSDTVADFAAVVDRIEDHDFAPPSLAQLRQALPGMRRPFGTAVCRNCDARFSCGPYRRYMQVASRASEAAFKQYIEDLGPDAEREAYVAAALEAAPSARIEDLT
jgi:hypothetical protein